MNRHLLGALVSCAALALCRIAHAGVVISQVYGGGGNTGAAFANDFVELFNDGPGAQSLAGWSVQYASAAGTTWQVTALSGTIPPGQYLLVGEASGGMNGGPLPTPDIVGVIAMASASGKVALVSSTMVSGASCPLAGITVDLVGYGTTDCFEGSGPTGAASNAKSVVRSNLCDETNDNSADFAVVDVNPHNSQSAHYECQLQIGYGVLLFPAFATINACQPTTLAYGQVYVPGATDISATPALGVLAELGVGPSGTDPASAPGWRWTTAVPNPGYDFTQNNDEYQQGLLAHASGNYDYAYRFTYNAGSQVYADLTGTTDGYSAANAGKLTVSGDVIYCDQFDD